MPPHTIAATRVCWHLHSSEYAMPCGGAPAACDVLVPVVTPVTPALPTSFLVSSCPPAGPRWLQLRLTAASRRRRRVHGTVGPYLFLGCLYRSAGIVSLCDSRWEAPNPVKKLPALACGCCRNGPTNTRNSGGRWHAVPRCPIQGCSWLPSARPWRAGPMTHLLPCGSHGRQFKHAVTRGLAPNAQGHVTRRRHLLRTTSSDCCGVNPKCTSACCATTHHSCHCALLASRAYDDGGRGCTGQARRTAGANTNNAIIISYLTKVDHPNTGSCQ